MKKEIVPSVILTIVCIILLSGVYPAVMWGIAQLAPNNGNGFIIKGKDNKYFYENIGQNFSDDKYFWSRPSAVGYNAAGSGGSNKGPDNPDYLSQVEARIDTFVVHNPGIDKSQIPSDMVTASGSGLDPHLSVEAATIQVLRIAKARNISGTSIVALIEKNTEKPLLGVLGPESVNVLKLNIELDKMNE